MICIYSLWQTIVKTFTYLDYLENQRELKDNKCLHISKLWSMKKELSLHKKGKVYFHLSTKNVGIF